jgi:hypothetical protein
MSAIRTVIEANRVQALTIDTTIPVSTFFLSNVNGLPETPAIYRSSVNQSNVVFEHFLFGGMDKQLKTRRNDCRGRYTAVWPPGSDE